MIILIIGGSGSGKSEYAEQISLELSGENGTRYYLATMKSDGDENRKRISRHVLLREGKNFVTIEQSVNIGDSVAKMININNEKNVVLLECISNLVANEMFVDSEIRPDKEVIEKVVGGVKKISENVSNLVIVSNNVHEDGIRYDEYTYDYIKTLGSINKKLSDMADKVVEVVVGIPVVVK